MVANTLQPPTPAHSTWPKRVFSERLTIRPTRESDLRAIYALHSIDHVNEYLPYQTWTTIQDALDWYHRVQTRRADNQSEQYTIVFKSTQRLVGTCLVFDHNLADHSAEIGYVLHPDFWRQGYMYEAMQAFSKALQKRLKLKRLRACVVEPNRASAAMLVKLNFSLIETSTEEDGTRLQHWLKKLT